MLTGNGLRGRERRGLASLVGRVVWAAHAGSLVVTPIGNHGVAGPVSLSEPVPQPNR